MIPKVIHYCWFGSKELPQLEQYCIETWKKKLPSYEIKLWNETNFNVEECDYVKQAYDKRKYAFVSDYVRAKILYEYGGIYLDTDVEVLKDLTSFLENEAFLGFENRTTVGTAVMAFSKGHFVMKQMLVYYHKHPFLSGNGTENLTTNVTILNSILEAEGMIRENRFQKFKGIVVYPRSYFFPKKISETKFNVTDNSCTIHRMNGSWLTERQKKRGSNKFWINVCRPNLKYFRRIITTVLGEKISKRIEIYVRNILK